MNLGIRTARSLRALAVAGIAAVVAGVTVVAPVASAEISQAAPKYGITITPSGNDKVTVKGTYPATYKDKSGKTIDTTLYLMHCGALKGERPGFTNCDFQLSGKSAAHKWVAPAGAKQLSAPAYKNSIEKVGTVKNGVWTFSVTMALPKKVKVNGKTVNCVTSTCGIGVRLSHASGLNDSRFDALKKVTKKSAKVTLAVKSLKRNKAGKATLTVKTVGVARPTGKFTVKVGKKTVTKSIKSSAKGKTTVTLPKLKKGKHTVKVTFTPTGNAKIVSKKTTKSFKVTVK